MPAPALNPTFGIPINTWLSETPGLDVFNFGPKSMFNITPSCWTFGRSKYFSQYKKKDWRLLNLRRRSNHWSRSKNLHDPSRLHAKDSTIQAWIIFFFWPWILRKLIPRKRLKPYVKTLKMYEVLLFFVNICCFNCYCHDYVKKIVALTKVLLKLSTVTLKYFVF